MDRDAIDILRRMQRAYASCRSYRDTGVVTTSFFNKPRDFTTTLHFETRFVRGIGFRFDFRTHHPYITDIWSNTVVWTKGDRVFAWWSARPEEVRESDLQMAIAGATGVSSGTASRVPVMLMPELGLISRNDAPPRIIPCDDPEARGCVVVEQRQTSDWVERFWIDLGSSAIRRVMQPRHRLNPPEEWPVFEIETDLSGEELASFRAAHERMRKRTLDSEYEAVTIYQHTIDVDIEPSELVFTPPE